MFCHCWEIIDTTLISSEYYRIKVILDFWGFLTMRFVFSFLTRFFPIQNFIHPRDALIALAGLNYLIFLYIFFAWFFFSKFFAQDSGLIQLSAECVAVRQLTSILLETLFQKKTASDCQWLSVVLDFFHWLNAWYYVYQYWIVRWLNGPFFEVDWKSSSFYSRQ